MLLQVLSSHYKFQWRTVGLLIRRFSLDLYPVPRTHDRVSLGRHNFFLAFGMNIGFRLLVLDHDRHEFGIVHYLLQEESGMVGCSIDKEHAKPRRRNSSRAASYPSFFHDFFTRRPANSPR